MTRHLSLIALVFGLVTTGSLAVAASLHQSEPAAASSVRIVHLDRVTVTAKRLAPAL